jgi:signal transduction histidine kinase
MSVRAYSRRRWTAEDAQTLTLLAAQVAPVLEAARLYERTRDARLEAEAAISMRDEVLAGVSHDLAGPLARIRLYAELMQSESAVLEPPESAAQMGQWSERIVAATATMKSIIQELLDVARLQMGEALQLNCHPTDLVALARRNVGEHQQSGHNLRLVTSADELVGWWDEARLTRVLSNLLDNATKYSERGEDVTVSIEADASGGDSAVLRVEDHGVGIPAADLPRVFERFFRGSNAIEQAQGTGLGLSVARQIVVQHGGFVDIESRPGAGTVVTLRLPRSGPSESHA